MRNEDDLVCPLSLCLPIDPVVCDDGEASSVLYLEHWLARSNVPRLCSDRMRTVLIIITTVGLQTGGYAKVLEQQEE